MSPPRNALSKPRSDTGGGLHEEVDVEEPRDLGSDTPKEEGGG